MNKELISFILLRQIIHLNSSVGSASDKLMKNILLSVRTALRFCEDKTTRWAVASTLGRTISNLGFCLLDLIYHKETDGDNDNAMLPMAKEAVDIVETFIQATQGNNHAWLVRDSISNLSERSQLNFEINVLKDLLHIASSCCFEVAVPRTTEARLILCLCNCWVRCDTIRVTQILLDTDARKIVLKLALECKDEETKDWAFELLVCLMNSANTDMIVDIKEVLEGIDLNNTRNRECLRILMDVITNAMRGISEDDTRVLLFKKAIWKGLGPEFFLELLDQLSKILQTSQPHEIFETMKCLVQTFFILMGNDTKMFHDLDTCILGDASGFDRLMLGIFPKKNNLYLKERVLLCKWILTGSQNIDQETDNCDILHTLFLKAFLSHLPFLCTIIEESSTEVSESTEQVTVYTLDAIHIMTQKNFNNITRCTRAGVFSVLLELVVKLSPDSRHLLKSIIQFALTLGRHKMNRSDVRRIMCLLSRSNSALKNGTMLALQWLLLQLCYSARDPMSFSLDKTTSAIKIPRIQGVKNGFTVQLWLRIESLQPQLLPKWLRSGFRKVSRFNGIKLEATKETVQPPSYYNPRIFSVMSKENQACSMEVLIQNGILVVHTLDSKCHVSDYFFETKIPLNQWFCFTLTVTKAVSMLSVPEAKLFIDGNLKEKKQIKVPTYFSDVFMAIGNGVGKNDAHALRAQIASVCVSHPVNDASVYDMYSTGLSKFGLLEGHINETEIGKGLDEKDDPKLESIKKKFLVTLYPQASDAEGMIARNVTGYSRGYPTSDTDKITLDTQLYENKTIVDALWAEGGACLVAVSLQLGCEMIKKLDFQKVKNSDIGVQLTLDDTLLGRHFPYGICDAFVSQGFALFAHMLHPQPGFFVVPEKEKRIAIRMFSEIQSDLDTRLCSSCIANVSGLIDASMNSPSVLRATLEGIVFNFDIWSQSTEEAQQAHMNLLFKISSHNREYLRKKYGISLYLRGLAKYCNQSQVHTTIRSKLIEIIQLFSSYSVSSSEIDALISFIRNAGPNLVMIEDVSLWLYHALRAFYIWQESVYVAGKADVKISVPKENTLAAAGQHIESALLKTGAPFELYACLSRESALVRSSILWIIANMCSSSLLLNAEDKEMLRLTSHGFAGVLTFFMDGVVNKKTIDAFIALGTSMVMSNRNSTSPDLMSNVSVFEDDTNVITSHPQFLSPRQSAKETHRLSIETSPSVASKLLHSSAEVLQFKVDTPESISCLAGPRQITCGPALLAALHVASHTKPGLGEADVCVYALDRIRELVQICVDASTITQRPGWPQVVLRPLHSLTDWKSASKETQLENLSVESLIDMFHPRCGYVMKLLNSLIFSAFEDGQDLGNVLRSTLDLVGMEMTGIRYSMLQQENPKEDSQAVESAFIDKSTINSVPTERDMKMWLCAALLEYLATRWGTVVFSDNEDIKTINTLVDITELLLFSQLKETSVFTWKIQSILALSLLDFTRTCDAEFRSRSNAEPGSLEINLRIVLEILLLASVPKVVETVLVKQAETWLSRFRASTFAEKYITAERALYIIWHLDKGLRLRLEDAERSNSSAVAHIVPIFRKFVRFWWWCFSDREEPTKNYTNEEGSTDAESIRGPNDPRLAADASIDTLTDLMFCSWWQTKISCGIQQAAMNVMSNDHLEDSRVSEFGTTEETAIQHALWDSRGRNLLQGRILTRASQCDRRHGTQELRILAYQENVRNLALAYTQAWNLALIRPLGSLALKEQDIWELESIMGPQIGQWRMDPTEDAIRARRKLIPIPDKLFDTHETASALRDNKLTEHKNDGRESSHSSRPETLIFGDAFARTPDNSNTFPFCVAANRVRYMSTVPGYFDVTPEKIVFVGIANHPDVYTNGLYDCPDFELGLAQLREMHTRRFNLRSTAIEFFSVDQANYFINFGSTSLRDKIYNCISSLDTPSLVYAGIRNGAELLEKSGLTKRWQQRKISNFEYLMQLNTIAGRTYNDLNQYPVFPWILADYDSEDLDLTNPKTFRDLSKPVGALNEDRVEFLKMMYAENNDPSMGKFHYGTHYSNAAFVLHFLIRLEPYTSLHIDLQSGKFDHADRQFVSIRETWAGIAAGSSDVKELIPEMFFLPELFENNSKYDLGCLQNGHRVNDVILPQWAKNANEFVRKHMEALESDYVSNNLHSWIDLIFGYKQRGEAAEEAVNVFLFSSYEGNVDLDTIPDARERKAMEDMIRELGQTPSQLLTVPHPPRGSLKFDTLNLFTLKKAYSVELNEKDPVACVLIPGRKASVSEWMQSGLSMKLITVSSGGFVSAHDWFPNLKSPTHPFTFDVDTRVLKTDRPRVADGVMDVSRELDPRLFCLAPDNSTILMAGAWTRRVHALRLAPTNASRTMIVATSAVLPDVSTCIQLDHDGKTVVVGMRNGVCAIYRLSMQASNLEKGTGSLPQSRKREVTLQGPLMMIYGHRLEVTKVCSKANMDMLLSASRDGTINVHTMFQGKYVRTIKPLKPKSLNGLHCTSSVELVECTPCGEVIVSFETWKREGQHNLSFSMHAFSTNGKVLASDPHCGELTALISTHDGKLFITGTRSGLVTIRFSHNLEVMSKLSTKQRIISMAIAPNENYIFIGIKDGRLLILPKADK
eukprot:m.276762 g.276762  ORF g.276762 m.276762 type:complete len:2614 (-) comp16305_c0_seq6:634-8475(-)